ncbi:OLC1v1014624C1 [Oldenlandia corymbosa var. corymbosa]|uniref:OLC1v1014624C1 n=1 Tax=Oldenlandia corymbosa var. corymbosa TaxID=529605 RepID=A0AAV1E140_OLDCO|nr:OLC1v1014624C1 [Oldenlandia corymbosa var. corymbosa]
MESLTKSFDEKEWVVRVSRTLDEELDEEMNISVSIFNVPKPLLNSNPHSYVPQQLAIGPYNDYTPQHCEMERRTRYQRYLDLNCDTLAWIMALDACFLLEFLRVFAIREEGKKIAHNAILRDIVMLENQIPIFLLRQALEFQFSSLDLADELLVSMLIGFCDQISPFKGTIDGLTNAQLLLIKCAHLLDILYHTIVPKFQELSVTPNIDTTEIDDEEEQDDVEQLKGSGEIRRSFKKSGNVQKVFGTIRKAFSCLNKVQSLEQPIDNILSKAAFERPLLMEEIVIPSVTELSKAGVKFSPTYTGIFSIKFDVITTTFYLPMVTLDVNSEIMFRNLVAYEVCSASGPLIFTRYTELMNGIVDTDEDVKILRQNGIIVNHLKSDKGVTKLWNGMSRSIRLTKVDFLDKTIGEVNKYYNGSYPSKIPANTRNPTSDFTKNAPKPPSKSNLSIPKTLPKTSPDSRDLLDLNPSIVLEMLYCYGNDWQKALEFFIWAENEPGFQHTTETYNRVIDILGKFFEFNTAWSLIERMGTKSPDSKPDRATFRVMFKRYVSAHLVKEAIDTFRRMEEFDLKDEVSFSNLIDALCEYKHVIEAEELCFGKNKDFDEVKYYKLDTKIYNIILRGWFKIGWWKKCREFWEEMDKRGVQKDLHSYSIYMDILCKSGKPWKAVMLYKEMKRKRIKLDVVAYNTVIRAIGISDGADVSIKLYREMIELGYEPNVVTYNTIIKLLCDYGRNSEAYNMLNEMFRKGCKPDVKTYHCFFKCLQKPQEILDLFDRMLKAGVQPSMDTYVLLMRKFGRWGFLRPVFLVWNKMEELGVSPDEFAYNALIDVLVQKGMLDMARKYDAEMLAKGLSAKPRVELGTKLITRSFAGPREHGSFYAPGWLTCKVPLGCVDQTVSQLEGSTLPDYITLEEELEEDTEVPVSIFYVPKPLMISDPDCYRPQQVAIGPYHHWRSELYDMERYKLASARRTQKQLQNLKFQQLVDRLTIFEHRIRACYHKYLDFNGETLAWMMAMDTCFLLEFLQTYASKEGRVLTRVSSRMSHLVDIAGRKSAHNAILRDIVMLENQIPLFLLRKTLELQLSSLEVADNILSSTLIGFCKELMPFKMMEDLPNVKVDDCVHLLDFLYHVMVPTLEEQREVTEIDEEVETVRETEESCSGKSYYIKKFLLLPCKILSKMNKAPVNLIKRIMFSRLFKVALKLPWSVISNLPGLRLITMPIEYLCFSEDKEHGKQEDPITANSNIDEPPLVEEITIPSVVELSKAGVQFFPTKEGILSIKFDEQLVAIYLPTISLDVNTEIVLRNLVAYEACNASGPLVFTRYTELMNGIIDTEEDAKLLREKGIILNRLKSDEEVANMWNGMTKSVRLTKVPFLDKVIEDVNQYYNGKWKVKIAKFMELYVFNSWQFLTLMAAALLLLLMTFQAFCSIYTCSHILHFKRTH